MKSRNALVCALTLLSLSLTAVAEAQQSIVAPSRTIDWSQAGVIGGPSTRAIICATLNPGATNTQINSAIANCPSGQVVKLNAGTYNLSGGLVFDSKNNVTLRGAGPDQTILNFAASHPCYGLGGSICIAGNNSAYFAGAPTHVVNWTAGYAKGATQITLSSVAGLSAGMMIFLDQLDDAADTGGVFVCDSAVCTTEGGGGAARATRGQNQIVRVTGISGATVTISPGLYMPNWRSSQSPQAFWGNGIGHQIEGVGVEDLSLNSASIGGLSAIYFLYAYNCWLSNVGSLNAPRNHVWLYQSAHNTIRDSYFYGTKNAASQSYGVETFFSSDNLVENNIFHHITGPITMNGSAAGLVVAYNYMIDDFYSASPNWMIPAVIQHEVGADMTLSEGNDGPGYEGDGIHGTHNFNTSFRNFWAGWEPGKTSHTSVVHLYSYARFYNIVGNVLGQPGYHTSYECNLDCPNGNGSLSIFDLGGTPGTTVPTDDVVKNTLLRWGNYDVVTGTSRFQAAEIPSGIAQFASPVPATTVLPGSFYLSAKPAFFGGRPWPAIGPDVTGGDLTGVGGHVFKIPARQCYENTSKANGILNFNARNCYGNAATTPPPPSPPANLRVIR